MNRVCLLLASLASLPALTASAAATLDTPSDIGASAATKTRITGPGPRP